MHHRHQVIDGRGLFLDIGTRTDLHDDFVQLIFHRFRVEFPDRGGDRYINIVIGILDFDSFEFLFFHDGIRQNSDHRHPDIIDLDLLIQNVPEAEQFLLGDDSEHADLGIGLFIGGKEKGSLQQLQVLNDRIGAAHAQNTAVAARFFRIDLVGFHQPGGRNQRFRLQNRLKRLDIPQADAERFGPDLSAVPRS